ncbi:MAG TPA: hypothetical protein VL463_20515 [Kofleriaceae bacterium]|nr:hypothetical protein [Kofleriaceae bacterium]
MRSALAIVVIAACHRGSKTETPKPQVPDAGVADAEVPVPDAPPDAPPARITFEPQPWKPGQTIKLWRKTTLSHVSGSEDLVDKYELSMKVDSADSNSTSVTIADDCKAVLARGTAKVSGECSGHANDVAYKLDLAAQLLAIPRGTVVAGTGANVFARPFVALFKLQDAGAIITAHLATATDQQAEYAMHAEIDGTMLRPGLHVLGKLDGTVRVDAHVTTISGSISAPKVVISGYPMADYTSKGALELAFGIEPQ